MYVFTVIYIHMHLKVSRWLCVLYDINFMYIVDVPEHALGWFPQGVRDWLWKMILCACVL